MTRKKKTAPKVTLNKNGTPRKKPGRKPNNAANEPTTPTPAKPGIKITRHDGAWVYALTQKSGKGTATAAYSLIFIERDEHPMGKEPTRELAEEILGALAVSFPSNRWWLSLSKSQNYHICDPKDS